MMPDDRAVFLALAETLRDELKAEVQQWLQDEAEALRFRFASQAPMWEAYNDAEDEVAKLGGDVDAALAQQPGT